MSFRGVTERRKFERRELEELAAKLYSASDGMEVDYCPINVSQQGLSIYTPFPLAVSAQYILALGGQDVPLVVLWCQPKDNDPALYRCGLEVLDPSQHLDTLIKNELSD